MAQRAARRGPSHPTLTTTSQQPAASSNSPSSASAGNPAASTVPPPPAPTSAWGKANPLIAAAASAPAPSSSSASPSASTPPAQPPPTSNGATDGPDKGKPAPPKETTGPSAAPAATSQAVPAPAAVTPPSELSAPPASTPASTPLPASLLSSVLQVGSRVRVTTLLGEQLEGEVFVYDAAARVLALQLPKDSHQLPDYSLLNTHALTHVQSISPASTRQSSGPSPSSISPRVLPEVDAAKLAMKEAKALSARAAEAAKIGVGVSARGQRMFDALSRLYGAVWQGSCIVLMDALRLDAPYTAEQLSGGSSQQRLRIIKTIEAQRDREAQSS